MAELKIFEMTINFLDNNELTITDVINSLVQNQIW